MILVPDGFQYAYRAGQDNRHEDNARSMALMVRSWRLAQGKPTAPLIKSFNNRFRQ